jgi:hypothetical protein
MREILDGFFFKDASDRNRIHVQGELVRSLGFVGREGDISFYRIKPNENICASQVCVKNLDPESMGIHPESRPHKVIKKHHLLKSIGLPVTRFMLANEADNMIVMPDLSNNGRYRIIDKHLPNSWNKIANVNDIRKRLFEIANLAYDCNFFLSIDSYMLILDRDTYMTYPFLVDIGARSRLIRSGELGIDRWSNIEQASLFLQESNLVRH